MFIAHLHPDQVLKRKPTQSSSAVPCTTNQASYSRWVGTMAQWHNSQKGMAI